VPHGRAKFGIGTLVSTFASSPAPIVQDARLLGKAQQAGGMGQQAALPSYCCSGQQSRRDLAAIVGASAGAKALSGEVGTGSPQKARQMQGI
jgi:hypothetical protein